MSSTEGGKTQSSMSSLATCFENMYLERLNLPFDVLEVTHLNITLSEQR